MKISGIFLCVVLAASLSGCVQVASVRPLYTEDEAEMSLREPRLEGDWVMANLNTADEHGDTPQSNIRVRIGSAGANRPYYAEFRWRENPGDEKETVFEYEVQFVPTGDSLFFDAVLSEHEENGKKWSQEEISKIAGITGHQLGQVWIGPQFVRFASLNPDWVSEHWPKAELFDNLVNHERSLTLTNQTTELRELLLKNAHDEVAFAPSLYLCRKGADCTALAVEDQLGRRPDGDDALFQGVHFYAKRGNYVKAIALQRRRIEMSKPSNGASRDLEQYELAKLLLLSREFGAAREVLKKVKTQPMAADPSPGELIVRSYFLQGAYPAVVQAANSVQSPNAMTAADSILLAYFALGRMGKSNEAEAFLRERTSAFQGILQEQVFLLKAAGRLTGDGGNLDAERDAYYSALKAMQTGNTRNAVTILQSQVARSTKDDLLTFADLIELERLSTVPVK